MVFVDAKTVSATLEIPPVNGLGAVELPGAALDSNERLAGASGLRLTPKEMGASADPGAQLRENQRLAIENILKRRRQALDAEYESAVQALTRAQSNRHARLLQDAIARTRPPFDRAAEQIGKLANERSRYQEFLELGPPYRTAQEVEYRDKYRAKIAEIDSKVLGIEAVYLAERDRILRDASTQIDRDLEQIRSNARAARLDDERILVAEIERVANEGERSQLRPGALIKPLNFSAIAAKTVRVSGRVPATQIEPMSPSEPDRIGMARDLIRIWAAKNGFKIVESRAGNADYTTQCVQWIKEQRAGRSANSPKNSAAN
jgi:hypothetical protein